MKKTLLMVLGVAFATVAIANQNPFERTKERKQAKQKMKMENSFPLKTSAGIENVPTLQKQSSWDEMNSSWMPLNALRRVYSNDLIVRDYQLNYAQTDTLYRSTLSYNSNKKLTQILGEQKMSGVYVPNSRYTLTYSNNDLKTVVVGETWDQFTQAWNSFSRATQEFNSRGDQTKYVYEQFNNGVWEVQFAFASQITYLGNTNKMLEYVDSSYNFNTKMFEANYKDVRTYNANEQVIDITSYSNNGVGLELSYRDSIFYTAGIPTKLIEYDYDAATMTFTKVYKFDNLTWNNFDPNIDLFYNTPTYYETSNWVNNLWELEERSTTTFPDSYGSYIQLEESYVNNAWVNGSRYRYLYDSRGNFIEETNEDYDEINNTWRILFGSKNIYMYDMSNNITEDISEYYEGNINAWKKEMKYEYADYITINTGINTNKNTLEVKLYPNPSTDGRVSINVNMEAASELSIKITDLKGSVVYTDKKELGKGLNTVELSGLQQGMYVVEMSTEAGLSRVKLIVK